MADPVGGTLVIMVKKPVVGRVKTRLARSIGAGEAARLYRTMTFALASRLGADPRWQTLLAVAPDRIRDAPLPVWPRHLGRIGQGGGDLGARMQRILDLPLLGPLLIVGSDIPGITPHHIARAFRLLGDADVIFGAAGDGGYWLVGCKRRARVPRLFDKVRWSSPHALEDSRNNARHLRVATADTLSDIDDLDGYLKWRVRSGRFVAGGSV